MSEIGNCMAHIATNITAMVKEMAKSSLANTRIGELGKSIKEKRSLAESIRKIREADGIGESLRGGFGRIKYMKNIMEDMFQPLLELAKSSAKRSNPVPTAHSPRTNSPDPNGAWTASSLSILIFCHIIV